MSSPQTSAISPWVLLILCAMPVFFSTNIVVGRAAISEVQPFTLAFLRWSFASLALIPFGWAGMKNAPEILRQERAGFFALAFCGMLICGGVLYFALKYTSATNGLLIYAAAPVFVIIFERIFRNRPTNWREGIGIVISFAGIVSIVTRGSISELLALRFNPGDILVVGCTICWAIYSVVIKREKIQSLPTGTSFLVIALLGSAILLPFALIEIITTSSFPTSQSAWISVGCLAIFPSVLAFSCYQYGVKTAGPVVTSIFIYLMPVSGIILAVIFLGENLYWYHGFGAALVLGGVILATFKR